MADSNIPSSHTPNTLQLLSHQDQSIIIALQLPHTPTTSAILYDHLYALYFLLYFAGEPEHRNEMVDIVGEMCGLHAAKLEEHQAECEECQSKNGRRYDGSYKGRQSKQCPIASTKDKILKSLKYFQQQLQITNSISLNQPVGVVEPLLHSPLQRSFLRSAMGMLIEKNNNFSNFSDLNILKLAKMVADVCGIECTVRKYFTTTVVEFGCSVFSRKNLEAFVEIGQLGELVTYVKRTKSQVKEKAEKVVDQNYIANEGIDNIKQLQGVSVCDNNSSFMQLIKFETSILVNQSSVLSPQIKESKMYNKHNEESKVMSNEPNQFAEQASGEEMESSEVLEESEIINDSEAVSVIYEPNKSSNNQGEEKKEQDQNKSLLKSQQLQQQLQKQEQKEKEKGKDKDKEKQEDEQKLQESESGENEVKRKLEREVRQNEDQDENILSIDESIIIDGQINEIMASINQSRQPKLVTNIDQQQKTKDPFLLGIDERNDDKNKLLNYDTLDTENNTVEKPQKQKTNRFKIFHKSHSLHEQLQFDPSQSEKKLETKHKQFISHSMTQKNGIVSQETHYDYFLNSLKRKKPAEPVRFQDNEEGDANVQSVPIEIVRDQNSFYSNEYQLNHDDEQDVDELLKSVFNLREEQSQLMERELFRKLNFEEIVEVLDNLASDPSNVPQLTSKSNFLNDVVMEIIGLSLQDQIQLQATRLLKAAKSKIISVHEKLLQEYIIKTLRYETKLPSVRENVEPADILISKILTLKGVPSLLQSPAKPKHTHHPSSSSLDQQSSPQTILQVMDNPIGMQDLLSKTKNT